MPEAGMFGGGGPELLGNLDSGFSATYSGPGQPAVSSHHAQRSPPVLTVEIAQTMGAWKRYPKYISRKHFVGCAPCQIQT